MDLIKSTVSIGLERPVRLLHVTDTHIGLADERDDERKHQLARRMCSTDKIAYLQEQLARFSLSDEITGIGNRNMAISSLENFINNHLRYEENFSVILLKIDNFGAISEKYGNTEANYTLLSIAQKLKAKLRGGDVATRYTDDQFLILIKDRKPSFADLVAKRLVSELEKINFDEPHPLKISVGVATHMFGENKEKLVSRALEDLHYL